MVAVVLSAQLKDSNVRKASWGGCKGLAGGNMTQVTRGAATQTGSGMLIRVAGFFASISATFSFISGGSLVLAGDTGAALFLFVDAFAFIAFAELLKHHRAWAGFMLAFFYGLICFMDFSVSIPLVDQLMEVGSQREAALLVHADSILYAYKALALITYVAVAFSLVAAKEYDADRSEAVETSEPNIVVIIATGFVFAGLAARLFLLFTAY